MKFKVEAFMPGAHTFLARDEQGKLHWVNPFENTVSPELPEYMIHSAISKYGCEEGDTQPMTMDELKLWVGRNRI